MSATWVVMRSHNDMPLVAQTLARLHEQREPFELLALDNASTDGTAEEIRKYTDRVVNVPQGEYAPGRVLNQGMRLSQGRYVVFLNSDCTPENEVMLENLLRGFSDDSIAAVFGRQAPRPDCCLLMAKDTEDTYGDGSRQRYWKHCFSMAVSAVRRSVWEQMPFNEQIQYSEDIEWTWRARQRGHTIRYVPDAIVRHSHNYSLRQFYRRQLGEGRADATIFEWDPWQRSLLRYSVLPYARQVAGDWKYCLPRLALGQCIYSPVLRMAQLLGRRKGFQTGRREVMKQPPS